MEEFTPPSRPSRLPPPAGPRTGPQERRQQIRPFSPSTSRERGKPPGARPVPAATHSKQTHFQLAYRHHLPGARPLRTAPPRHSTEPPPPRSHAAPPRRCPGAVPTQLRAATGVWLRIRERRKEGKGRLCFYTALMLTTPVLIQSAPGLRPTHRKVMMNSKLQLVSRSVL